jgi:hypothetical protein
MPHSRAMRTRAWHRDPPWCVGIGDGAHRGRLPPTADLLDTIRSQIDARLAELRPLVDEAASLEAALAALERSDGATAPARPRRRGSSATSAGRGARRRGETRERLIDYVRANPGSTAGDVATALGLNRNSVATRLAQLPSRGNCSRRRAATRRRRRDRAFLATTRVPSRRSPITHAGAELSGDISRGVGRCSLACRSTVGTIARRRTPGPRPSR